MDKRFQFLKEVIPFNILGDEVLQEVAEMLQEVRYNK